MQDHRRVLSPPHVQCWAGGWALGWILGEGPRAEACRVWLGQRSGERPFRCVWKKELIGNRGLARGWARQGLVRVGIPNFSVSVGSRGKWRMTPRFVLEGL